MGVSGVEASFNFEHQGELFNEEGKKEKNSHRADPSHPVCFSTGRVLVFTVDNSGNTAV